MTVSLTGRVVAVCISKEKGTPKEPVESVELVRDFGIRGDAHGAPGLRQISLLAAEKIRDFFETHQSLSFAGGSTPPLFGRFAENLAIEGIVLTDLPIGTQLQIGESVVTEVTQIGKTCHQGCSIRTQTGDCIMPRDGIFVKVIEEGTVKAGDKIKVIENGTKKEKVKSESKGTKEPWWVAIITISDRASAGIYEDQSGAILTTALRSAGFGICYTALVPDEISLISTEIVNATDGHGADLVLTTGGTGVSLRDVTPEATSLVLERLIPGIPELMRLRSMEKTSSAALSRALAGTRGKSLIVNLPGSPKGASECLDFIMPVLDHALSHIQGRDTSHS